MVAFARHLTMMRSAAIASLEEALGNSPLYSADCARTVLLRTSALRDRRILNLTEVPPGQRTHLDLQLTLWPQAGSQCPGEAFSRAPRGRLSLPRDDGADHSGLDPAAHQAGGAPRCLRLSELFAQLDAKLAKCSLVKEHVDRPGLSGIQRPEEDL